MTIHFISVGASTGKSPEMIHGDFLSQLKSARVVERKLFSKKLQKFTQARLHVLAARKCVLAWRVNTLLLQCSCCCISLEKRLKFYGNEVRGALIEGCTTHEFA